VTVTLWYFIVFLQTKKGVLAEKIEHPEARG
jgi:hypothetical protein